MPADEAGHQLQTLLARSAALHADMLQVRVEGQTIYIRGLVDSRLEYSEIDSLIVAVPGAHIVNETVVSDTGA